MSTATLPEKETKQYKLTDVLNRYLDQKLKGKTLLIAHKEDGEIFEPTDTCEVLYLLEDELNSLSVSLMEFHNVVTHNFNHLLSDIKSIQARCEKAEIRFIAFKDA